MILTRRQFGLPAEPWLAAPLVTTADSIHVEKAVRATVEGRAWLSVVGPRGTGKTRALRAALAAIDDVVVVEPCRLDNDRLHIGDIVAALVSNLSSERVRHSGEARAVQARRLLGSSSRPVLLLIDDADALHRATLRALKRLRELSWRGRSPLLSIALSWRADKADAIPEVGLRISSMQLTGPSQKEAARAITAVAGQICAPGVAVRLATSKRARNWLDMAALVDDCLLEATAQGEDTITPATADAVLNGAAKPSTANTAPAPPAASTLAGVLDKHEGATPAQRKRA